MDVFEKSFQKVVQLKGGFRGNNKAYAGILRDIHPEWEGWAYLDTGQKPPTDLVRKFYFENFWQSIDYEEIPSYAKAFIFEAAVSINLTTAIKLSQKAIGVTPDGVIGHKTLEAFKSVDEDFLPVYAWFRIVFYVNLANKDPQRYMPVLRSWLNSLISYFDFVTQNFVRV